MRVEASIRHILDSMRTLLDGMVAHIYPASRDVVRRYWLDDIKPELDENAKVVIRSLLLICNNEHIIKTKQAFLNLLETLDVDASTLDDDFLKKIVAMTMKFE